MARYAIILSAEEYTYYSPTHYAHADANLMHVTLTEHCDYAAQHALLLHLSPDQGTRPKDILDKIRDTVDGSTASDTILFYFAGHGHLHDAKPYLILPATDPDAFETTALPLADVAKELRVPNRICFRLLDACHSGVDVRGPRSNLDSGGFVRAITHDASGWVTLAACRDAEESVPDGQIGHGIFTHYVCQYIREQESDRVILPEELKVSIVPKVQAHANRLHHVQTPTFNVSVSGNVSLATRRVPTPSRQQPIPKIADNDLADRITSLRSAPDMAQASHLKALLASLVDTARQRAAESVSLGRLAPVGPFIRAGDIPEEMQPDIVIFSRRLGLHPRHHLERWEEEEQPITMADAVLSSWWRPKKKRVRYGVWQSPDLPESASILRLDGDGRVVPTVSLLLYVIPLQITICLLAYSFKHDWAPRDDEVEPLCYSHRILKPGMSTDEAEALARSSVDRTMEKIRESIVSRVEELQRELNRD